MPLSIGQIIDDRYRLTGLIGAGRVAVVYRAEQLQLYDRPCALKILRAGADALSEAGRFQREAALLMRIHSPHVVRIIDVGALSDGRAYFAMDLLEGQPLSALLTAGPLPASLIERALRGVLSGLMAAHAQGIIHRDLHPGNILLVGEGEACFPVILDFGLSREAKDHAELTTMGALIGTPTHLSPEQLRYAPIDARADLYALGITLYQMLTGAAPFTADAEVPAEVRPLPEILRVGWQHLRQPPPLMGLPPRWAGLLARLLAKTPEGRPASAQATLALLDAPEILEAEGRAAQAEAQANAPATPSRQAPRRQRGRARALLIGLLGLLGLLGLILKLTTD
ncbi:serine/threonine protein kinase [Myxococcota bacterium]|nr:serine/threonine protein kinase [Myxococcota bacterium]MBU1429125.1 serine/threonine protein kinase [Myxococcota bacterium]MBU1899761.1 serine/threonine protein kinase [Myxococcota bacterium]